MTDMSKELKALKLAHAVEKQIMQDNFTQCKTVGEYLKTENNNLRCCGNCVLYSDTEHECQHRQKTIANSYCEWWQTDGMTRGEREK